jgi:hypothetical protein
MMGCQTPGAKVIVAERMNVVYPGAGLEMLGRAEMFSPTPYPLGSPKRRFLKALAPWGEEPAQTRRGSLARVASAMGFGTLLYS